MSKRLFDPHPYSVKDVDALLEGHTQWLDIIIEPHCEYPLQTVTLRLNINQAGNDLLSKPITVNPQLAEPGGSYVACFHLSEKTLGAEAFRTLRHVGRHNAMGLSKLTLQFIRNGVVTQEAFEFIPQPSAIWRKV